MESINGGGERDKGSEPYPITQLKNTKGIAYVQILGTGMDTHDTLPSVLLFFDHKRFIFNAGEGLQRFCTEHKIKLSMIDHICLTRVCSETAGGIPGLLLTLAGLGESVSVNIWGPQDLTLLVDAMKSFVPHATIDTDCSADAIVNETVKISRIPLQPNCLEGSNVKPGDISMIYVCELPETMGRFDKDKAVALGITDRRKYGKLQRHESVKSDRLDILVHPSDVMGTPVPGPIIIIVDCPTIPHAQKLLSLQALSDFYLESPSDLPQNTKTVNSIIHLTPDSVVSCSSYQSWMKKFRATQHIMAGYTMKRVGAPVLKSSAKVAAQLNYLCPQLFPASALWSLSHNNADNAAPSSLASCKGPVIKLCEGAIAENLLKFVLRPPAKQGLDKSSVPSPVAQPEVISELLLGDPSIVGAAQKVGQIWLQERGSEEDDGTLKQDCEAVDAEPLLEHDNIPNCLENIKRDDLEIVFLGTGSSQPSKYRNVSSIFINLFSKGSLFLDCGEGTLAQLKRRYGIKGADSALRNLRCIWISHIHADHHAGLARILTARRDLLKGVPHEPLPVIAPTQLEKFLNAYQQLEDLDMQFIDCKSTEKTPWQAFYGALEVSQSNEFVGVPTDSEYIIDESTEGTNRKRQKLSEPDETEAASTVLKKLKEILSDAGLERLISVPVDHCPGAGAFGVVLEATERLNSLGKVIPGWKVVYSGDTRPCLELEEASQGATVLIHEATFEDGMKDEAISKKHSTTQEAIEVGISASAYRIILTHFSQRYPKVPALDEISMQRACIAFDLMSVNIADLPVIPHILPYLKLLFKDEIIEN